MGSIGFAHGCKSAFDRAFHARCRSPFLCLLVEGGHRSEEEVKQARSAGGERQQGTFAFVDDSYEICDTLGKGSQSAEIRTKEIAPLNEENGY